MTKADANASALRRLKMFIFSFLGFVGVAGFEPTTPCSQSRCANRTALHPDAYFRKASAKVKTILILANFLLNFSLIYFRILGRSLLPKTYIQN